MCGICGIADFDGNAIDRDLLRRMALEIRHRGPDGEGFFFSDTVALGHRRLSIIDIGGGAQPISNEDGKVHVVFNGEIYNFIELTKELQALGHVFKTRSDTEVIVHAYEQWGASCTNRFNGIFAFALWDERNRQLLLARDHLGVKPLYYTQAGSHLVFGSEIKTLLKHPACEAAVDLNALAQLFTFRYVPSPNTLFRGIHKLPPGHYLSASERGISIHRFWNWVPRATSPAKEHELVEEYQSLLQDAVRLQLRSDVPLGLFLSSGVDSAALLALMAQQGMRAPKTFTIGFENGESTNEVDDARELARRFGAEHYTATIRPGDYTEYYNRYMYDIEEPVGNETAAAFYFLAKLAKSHVKVALTGQGADEPWAGYDRYKGIKYSSLYSNIPELLTRKFAELIACIPGRFERLRRGTESLRERDVLTRLTKVYSFFSPELKNALYAGCLRALHLSDTVGPKAGIAHLHADVATLDPLSQALYIDTRASLPDDLLMVGDKTSMACSLEARVPFLDYRLIEFIETIPPSLKLKGLTGKYLHKKAMLKWLPKHVVYRKKKGFANPVDTWFRTSMRPFVSESLLAAESAVAQYFDQNVISRMIAEDARGRSQFRRHLYLLLSFELWHRRYIR